jgi:hypothetical protein
VFLEWFNEKIMKTDSDNPINAVMVLPYGIAGPKYRDLPPEYVKAMALILSMISVC